MNTPSEQYVETVARALHGKYGPASQVSWTSLKDEVRERWFDDARELLEEIRPDLRYVTARGQDHHELSEALGIASGLLEWHRLIEIVRQLRGVRPGPVGEFARISATTDVVRVVLRMLSAEYAEPHAHSDDDSEYAEDMLLEAARRLVAARAGDDPLMGTATVSQLAASSDAVAAADVVHSAEPVELDDLMSEESIQDGIVHGHPALYPLHVQSGRITPLRSWREQL